MTLPRYVPRQLRRGMASLTTFEGATRNQHETPDGQKMTNYAENCPDQGRL